MLSSSKGALEYSLKKGLEEIPLVTAELDINWGY